MYLALKGTHVLAVVLFLGNIITGLYWKAHGDRTGDPRIIAHTLHGIIRSDRWFTLPGVFAIVITGLMAAWSAHLPILRTPWIAYSILLFIASGVAFGWQVAPLQRRMQTMAESATSGGPWDERAYRSLSLRWELWGVFAIATPLAALALMIAKPGG